MKFDTSKKGIESVFSPYKIESLKVLMDAKKGLGSGRVWEALMNHPNEAVHMSRASIIFFLNDMVDDKICEWKDATGKGGHHRLYTIIPKNMAELKNFLIKELESFIERELRPNPTPPPPQFMLPSIER